MSLYRTLPRDWLLPIVRNYCKTKIMDCYQILENNRLLCGFETLDTLRFSFFWHLLKLFLPWRTLTIFFLLEQINGLFSFLTETCWWFANDFLFFFLYYFFLLELPHGIIYKQVPLVYWRIRTLVRWNEQYHNCECMLVKKREIVQVICDNNAVISDVVDTRWVKLKEVKFCRLSNSVTK